MQCAGNTLVAAAGQAQLGMLGLPRHSALDTLPTHSCPPTHPARWLPSNQPQSQYTCPRPAPPEGLTQWNRAGHSGQREGSGAPPEGSDSTCPRPAPPVGGALGGNAGPAVAGRGV